MNIMQQLRYLSFILIAIVSLLACTNKPSGDHGSTTNATSPAATIASPNAGASSGNNGWLVSLNDAYDLSAKGHKPIMVYFAGSDTCGLCKQLEANVFTAAVFKDWAEKNLVLLRMDAPKDSQHPIESEDQNAAMARSLKVTIYPTIWLLSITHEVENGRFKVKPIGKVGYESSPEKFVGMMNNLLPPKGMK